MHADASVKIFATRQHTRFVTTMFDADGCFDAAVTPRHCLCREPRRATLRSEMRRRMPHLRSRGEAAAVSLCRATRAHFRAKQRCR